MREVFYKEVSLFSLIYLNVLMLFLIMLSPQLKKFIDDTGINYRHGLFLWLVNMEDEIEEQGYLVRFKLVDGYHDVISIL